MEVLVVDDDEIILILHKTRVKKMGLHPNPISKTNGLEALNYILSNNFSDTHFLVLLDINMPLMNGWEFLNELEKNTMLCRISVAIVTSSIDDADKEMADQYPRVIDFIEKPLSDLNLKLLMEKFR